MIAELQMISVESLTPTPDNPRVLRHDAPFKELVNSIRDVGILQPLIARPMPDGQVGRYDLRAGHRRLEAAKEAGLSEVPVLVREMDDATAALVTVTENKDRQDLTPLEESRSVRLLLNNGMTHEVVADKLGKSPRWVARRAKLADLDPSWVKLIDGDDSKLEGFSAVALEEIARLSVDAQREMAKEVRENKWGLPHWADSIADLREHISTEYLLQLTGKQWRLDDAELVPKAGACSACPKRASLQPLLFADVDEGEDGEPKKTSKHDRCLDRACFDRKLEAHQITRYAVDSNKNGKPLPVVKFGGLSQVDEQELKKRLKVDELVHGYEVSECKAGDKGAKAAFDPDKNRTVYYRTHASSYGGNGSTQRSVDKRNAEEVRAGKRMKCVLNSLEAIIDKARDGSVDKPLEGVREFTTFQAMRAALVFGLYAGTHGKDFDIKQILKAGDDAPLRRSLQQEAMSDMQRRVAAHNSVIARQNYEAGRKIAELLDVDFAALEAAALKEIPEPGGTGGDKKAPAKKAAKKAKPTKTKKRAKK